MQALFVFLRPFIVHVIPNVSEESFTGLPRPFHLPNL